MTNKDKHQFEIATDFMLISQYAEAVSKLLMRKYDKEAIESCCKSIRVGVELIEERL